MTQLDVGESRELRLSPGRNAWLQVARGSLSLNGNQLEEGAGAAVSEEERLALVGREPAEALVFDLA